MKTIRLLLTLVTAIIVVACAKSENKEKVYTSYVVEGYLPDSSCHGERIYLQRYTDDKSINTTRIQGNRFTFTGVANTAEFCYININRRLRNQLIVENGHIKIEMKYVQLRRKQPFATGTPGNKELTHINTLQMQQVKESSKIMDSLRTLYPDKEELFKMAQPKIKALEQRIVQQGKELFAKHRNSAIAISLFQSLFYHVMSEDDKMTVIESLTPRLRNTRFVENEVTKINNAKKIAIGTQFKDFQGTDLKGNPSKLSDYVGKGNYVLVDFWASWCGPCRAESPNIKAIHEKYNGKGLIVLGICVNDKIENTKAAIKDDNITWAQLVDSERKAMPLYGLNAIPRIILFSPDGKILENKLRGKEMILKVKEYMESEKQ